jgi:transcriptional regulator with XRE-family HTH domain
MKEEVTINPARLVEAREELGLKQSEVAEKLGWSRQAVWAYEQGEVKGLHKILQLIRFYNKPLEYFLCPVSDNHSN